MRKSGTKLMAAIAGLLGVAVVLAGCSQGYVSAGGQPTSPPVTGSATQPPAPEATAPAGGPVSSSSILYQQKPLNATVSGSAVTLSMAEVAQTANGNFGVNYGGNYLTFMAYELDGKFFVRADICPPCGSRSFHLQNGKLICDSCGTVFNATTGAPISGACVAYPKALVPYTTSGGNIVLNMSDLTTAFTKTINRQGLK